MIVTYQDLEQSGVPFPVFAKICKVANIYDWKLRGIPTRYQKILFSVITNAKRAAENKAAFLAAVAPQIDLFKSTDDNVRIKPDFINKNNNLTNDLRGFSPSPLANNRKSVVSHEPRGFQDFDDSIFDFVLSLYAVVSSILVLENCTDKVNNQLAFFETAVFSLLFTTLDKYDAAIGVIDEVIDDFYSYFLNAVRPSQFDQRLLPREHIVLTAIRAVLKEDICRNEDKYFYDLDSLAYASVSEDDAKKNPYLEYQYLSSIVRKIESKVKIDTFKQIRKQGGIVPPAADATTAHNCGRRVMGQDLKNKIYGDNAPKGAVDIIACEGKFSFKGLMVCKDVWGCPTCARKITERRKNGLGLLLNAHVDKYAQNSISATLFTVPHGLGSDLEDILDRLHGAYRFMTMTSAYKALMKQFGMRGSTRALESTYGNNGFHPHFHILHFFDHNLKKESDYSPGGDIEFIREALFAMWTKALKRFDFPPPDIRAFGCVAIATDKKSLADVADYFGKVEKEVGESDINAYMKKHKNKGVRSVDVNGKTVTHHWGEEAEMTKWHIKKGGNYHYSMFDFLRGYAISELQGDNQNAAIFKDLWLTYRRGFKGRRQLYTTHKDFKIPELELADAEVSDLETKAVKTVVLSVDFEDWVNVLRCNARGSLLRVIQKEGDTVAFFQHLRELASIKKELVIKQKTVKNELAIKIQTFISRRLFTRKQITDYLCISFKMLDSWYYQKIPIVYIPIIEKFLQQFTTL
jgi:hypothetical protein